jgi:hypothetical protein
VARYVVAAALLLAAQPLAAGSGATFTLGLGVEYLSDEQDLGGLAIERNNLRTILGLAIDGHLVDPRFMTFQARVDKALSDQSLTNQPDTNVDETAYDGGFRLFSNRAISVEAGAGRHDTDIDGLQQGAFVDGVREYHRYGVRARGGGWFKLNLFHHQQSFEADDATRLRDEDATWTELTSQAAIGIVDAGLQLLWKENDLYSNELQQQIGSGRFDLDVNQTGRVYWHSDVISNRYRSATQNEPYGPWTENLLTRNRLRHRYSERGFWEVRGTYQVIQAEPLDDATTATAAFLVVAPISESALFEAEVGYLETEASDGFTVTQPTASTGIRWGRRTGRWWIALNPRISYVTVDATDRERESSLGSMVYASARRDYERGSITFEGEYFDNQLTIPEYGPGDVVGGASFLAGLERERQRARVIVELRPRARRGGSAEVDYRRRVRLDRSAEVTEDVARARVSIFLGPVVFGASGDRIEVVGGEIPSVTDVWQVDLGWSPAYWLVFDTLARSENRQVLGIEGVYELAELGVRLGYAKLSFYARVRAERIEESGLEARDNRRIWAGVRRTFDFRVGARQ